VFSGISRKVGRLVVARKEASQKGRGCVTLVGSQNQMGVPKNELGINQENKSGNRKRGDVEPEMGKH
jgi:hypothetical protein